MNSSDDRRLNKFIADSGFCSRREADRQIAEGKVSVNGRVAKLGDRVATDAHVKVGKHEISPSGDKVYIAAYKPMGIVSTAESREAANIVNFINFPGRIYPIGRLDKDSEGLILLTSDGDIVNRILRASGKHEKEYEVAVDKPVTPEFLNSMSAGIPILGQVTLPCQVRKTGTNSFRIILVQGLNRQIRRMCEYLGYNVFNLRRLRIMNINLGGMRAGEWRLLTDAELNTLKKSLNTMTNKKNDMPSDLD